MEGQIYLFTAKSATFEPFYAEDGAPGLKSGLVGHRKAGQTKKKVQVGLVRVEIWNGQGRTLANIYSRQEIKKFDSKNQS